MFCGRTKSCDHLWIKWKQLNKNIVYMNTHLTQMKMAGSVVRILLNLLCWGIASFWFLYNGKCRENSPLSVCFDPVRLFVWGIYTLMVIVKHYVVSFCWHSDYCYGQYHLYIPRLCISGHPGGRRNEGVTCAEGGRRHHGGVTCRYADPLPTDAQLDRGRAQLHHHFPAAHWYVERSEKVVRKT